MSDLADRLAKLSPEQLDLLSKRAEERRRRRAGEPGTGEPTTVPPRDPSTPAPLSFAQERLWLIEQLGIPGGLYNVPTHLDLEGRLVCRALEQSLGEVARRHEILRTRYLLEEEAPVQTVEPPAMQPLATVDLSGLDDGDRRRELRRLASADAARPFDLEAAPPARTTLVRRSPRRHALFLTLHHVACDGASSEVLLRETAALYAAGLGGGPSPLPEPPIQYADFAAWQRGRLTAERVAEETEFWRRRLDAEAVLELPTDRPRPAVQTFRGARRPLALDAPLRDALGELARRHRASSFVAIVALLQALLSRVTHQRRVRVGTPVSGRYLRELEGLVGPFLNTLVLETEIEPELPFGALLERVRDTVFEAQEHQELPFEKLVEELQPQRNLSYPPLFQVMLNLERAGSGGAPSLPELTIEPLPFEGETAKFDLTLGLVEGARGLTGSFEYNADLFDATTVERLGRQLRRLAAAVAADPETPPAAVSLLSQAERHQLLAEWADPDSVAGSGPGLDELFAAQAAAGPDRLALTWRDEGISYGELARRVDHWAQVLRREGVGPETIVAVAADRGPGMVIALLAVLAAGGAYLPLDPAYPAARLELMLEDSGAALLLTDGREPPVTLPPGVRRLELDWNLDRDLDPLGGEPPTLAGRLAYVIYTSGSTGRPKGVAVQHDHVTRLLATTAPWLGPGDEDAWTLFHSYAFDFSVWELWGALAHGGRLVVVPYWTSRSPESFHRLVAEQRVTVLNQTPSAFRAFVEADSAAGGETPLSWVLFGGEALEVESLEPWWRRRGAERTRLVNLYGITETTVHVTRGPLRAGSPGPRGRGSFIGRPLGDLAAYLLDGSLGPVPVGVEGELWVGGAGVSRGYLGRPALTSERFRPDPFGRRPGARLYRSGDLGRFRADGHLEYLGRADQQVKVRGFRIEPGEIEAELRRQPGVSEAVVVLAGGEADTERRLVAYVLAEDAERPPGADELRESLRQRLPDHMVPGAYVALPELPLTPSGKIDRRNLPRPDGRTASTAQPYVAPRSEMERRLAALWTELLEVERVGIDDNFFDLGGHSLLIVRLARRVRDELGHELPLMTLFRHPTVASLSRHLVAEEEEEAAADESPEAREDESRSRADRKRRAIERRKNLERIR